MHPDILRDMTSQRGVEMRARAHRAKIARMVSRANRASRRGHGRADEFDGFAMPAIPDYVDGSFRTEPAEERVASEPGQAPAARHAA
jgi:hypothetical protein